MLTLCHSNSYEGNLFTWLFLGPTLNVSEQFYESFWVSAMPKYLPPAANVTLLKELYDPIANSSVRDSFSVCVCVRVCVWVGVFAGMCVRVRQVRVWDLESVRCLLYE